MAKYNELSKNGVTAGEWGKTYGRTNSGLSKFKIVENEVSARAVMKVYKDDDNRLYPDCPPSIYLIEKVLGTDCITPYKRIQYQVVNGEEVIEYVVKTTGFAYPTNHDAYGVLSLLFKNILNYRRETELELTLTEEMITNFKNFTAPYIKSVHTDLQESKNQQIFIDANLPINGSVEELFEYLQNELKSFNSDSSRDATYSRTVNNTYIIPTIRKICIAFSSNNTTIFNYFNTIVTETDGSCTSDDRKITSGALQTIDSVDVLNSYWSFYKISNLLNKIKFLCQPEMRSVDAHIGTLDFEAENWEAYKTARQNNKSLYYIPFSAPKGTSYLFGVNTVLGTDKATLVKNKDKYDITQGYQRINLPSGTNSLGNSNYDKIKKIIETGVGLEHPDFALMTVTQGEGSDKPSIAFGTTYSDANRDILSNLINTEEFLTTFYTLYNRVVEDKDRELIKEANGKLTFTNSANMLRELLKRVENVNLVETDELWGKTWIEKIKYFYVDFIYENIDLFTKILSFTEGELGMNITFDLPNGTDQNPTESGSESNANTLANFATTPQPSTQQPTPPINTQQPTPQPTNTQPTAQINTQQPTPQPNNVLNGLNMGLGGMNQNTQQPTLNPNNTNVQVETIGSSPLNQFVSGTDTII